MPSQERVDPSSQTGHRANWLVRNWQTILLLLGSAVVLLLALRVRLPNLGGRSLLLDECFHNESVLDSPDLGSLRRSVSLQYQPLLDYFLRRVLWAPLVGTSELGLRLPSLIASLLAVLATIATVAWGFVKNGRAWTEAVVAALALGVWQAGNPQGIVAAGFGRHYALAGFLSILWMGLFVFGEPLKAWKRLAIASLLLANTHFFAMAMIGTGYGFLAVQRFLHGRWRAGIREIAVLFGVVVLTAAINWPALSTMVYRPLDPRSISQAGVFLTAFAETWGLLGRFAEFLDLPVLGTGLVLVLVLVGGLTLALPRIQVAKVLVLVCVAIPGFLFVGRLRSEYSFGSRYFMPFLGLAPVLAALGGVCLAHHLQRLVARLFHDRVSPRTATGISLLPFGAYLLVAGLGLALLPGRLGDPDLPSTRARFIESIKREARPVFLLSSPCWSDAVVRFYWRRLGILAPKDRLQIADQPGYEACVIGGFPPGSQAEGELKDFLARSPDGIVAFYQHHFRCFPPRFALPMSVTIDSTGDSCLTVLREATSAEQVRAVASAIGFPIAIRSLLEQRQ